jgi:hypothetical protein
MNKIKGLLLIIITSFFILVFALALFVFIPDLFQHNNNKFDSYIAIVFLSIFLTLFLLGFRYGLKMLKTPKPREIIEYNRALNIQFTGQINFKEYRNLMFQLSFKRLWILILIGFTCFIIVNLTMNGSYLLSQKSTLTPLIIFGLSLITVPGLLIYQLKKAYNSNMFFHQNIQYYLSNESLRMIGESIESEIKWVHFYKLKETKYFFVFYQGSSLVNLLDKKMMKSSDIIEFSLFLKSLKLRID